jgi:hypothetical protein
MSSWKDTISEESPEQTESWKNSITTDGETISEEAANFDDPLAALSAAVSNPFQMGPRLDAAAESLLEKVYPGKSPEDVNKELREQGFTGDIQPRDFDEKVAEARAYREMLEKYNPKSYGLGAVGREIGTSLVGLPIKAAQGLGIAAKYAPLAAGAATNVIQGALTGAGESQASLTQDPAQLLEDTLIGASIGGAFGVAGEGLQKIGKAAVPFFKEAAETKAVQGLGYTKKQLKNIKKSNKADFEKILEQGRYALDKKIVTPFSSPEDRFEKIQDLVGENENILNDALTKMDSVLSNEPKSLERFGKSINDIKQQALDSFLEKNPNAKQPDVDSFKKALDVLSDYGDDVMGNIKLSPKDLQAEKIALNTAGKYADIGNTGTTVSTTVDAARALRDQYKNTIEDYGRLSGTISGEEATNIKNVNKELGDLYRLREAAENQVLNELKGSSGTKPGDVMMGLGIAGMDPKLLAAKGISDITGKYGRGLLATGADTLKSGFDMVTKQSDNLPLQSVIKTAATAAGKWKATENVVADVKPETPEQTAMLSQQVRQIKDPKAQQLADLLQKASQGGEQKRNSQLFSIMQDKDYRKLLNELKLKNKGE